MTSSVPTRVLPAPVADATENVPVGKRVEGSDRQQHSFDVNDISDSNSDSHVAVSTTDVKIDKRRGRPRLLKPRDESAIEKRRAQVREAQRTYQKRKESATATEKRRVDELLQVIADLSADVEKLLQSASTSGNMYREDDVSKHIQQLWSTYNTAINSDSVKPELRLQQMKNDKRQTDHRVRAGFLVVTGLRDPQQEGPQTDKGDTDADRPRRHEPSPFDAGDVNFNFLGFEDTSVMQTFQRSSAINGRFAGRSIFDICVERQAAMKQADKRRDED